MDNSSRARLELDELSQLVASVASTPQPTGDNAERLGALIALRDEGQVKLGKLTRNFDFGSRLDRFGAALKVVGATAAIGAVAMIGVATIAPAVATVGLVGGAALATASFFGGSGLQRLVKGYIQGQRHAVYETSCWLAAGAKEIGEGRRAAPQMSEREAVAFADGGAWKTWSDEKILGFQLGQRLTCIPFDRVMKAADNVLGRPVNEYEFTNPDKLRAEAAEKVGAKIAPPEAGLPAPARA